MYLRNSKNILANVALSKVVKIVRHGRLIYLNNKNSENNKFCTYCM